MITEWEKIFATHNIGDVYIIYRLLIWDIYNKGFELGINKELL